MPEPSGRVDHAMRPALPEVIVPPDATWRWMIDTIDAHGERAHWREVLPDPLGKIQAGDGAIVLLHTWPGGTAEGLPTMIDGLRELGATFVTVASLAEVP